MSQHRFKNCTFNQPSFCFLCRQYIWGVGKIGYRCRTCHYVCHKRCKDQVPNDCLPNEKNTLANASEVPTLAEVESKIHALAYATGSAEEDDGALTKVSKTAPVSYQPGAVEDDYVVGAELGSGGCATVYLGTARQGSEQVAIKRLDKSGFELALLERELRIMNGLRHKSIVALLAAYNGKQHVDLVLELVEGGELFDAIIARGQFAESDAQCVMKQLIEGIAYVHQKGVAHRDLKAENVLMVQKDALEVKIADFGLANVLGTAATASTACGTPDYVAPEILLGEQYSFPVDLWSLGILSYILLCGYPPFWADTQTELFRRIIDCEYTFSKTDWADVSDIGINFVAKLLVQQAPFRLTARQALHHPWLEVKTAPPLSAAGRAKNSVRNLVDYAAARKSGSTTYVPLAAVPARLTGVASPLASPVHQRVGTPTSRMRDALTPAGTPTATRVPSGVGSNEDDDDDSSSSVSEASGDELDAKMSATVKRLSAVALGDSPTPSLSDFLTNSDDSQLDASLSPSSNSSSESYYSSEKLEDIYTLGEEIGRGGCAVVYHAYHKQTQEHWAVKRLDKRNFELRLLERELSIMRRLKHPHVLRMEEAFDSNSHVDLVVEFVDGGELFDAIVDHGGLAEADCVRIVRQILEALVYLHSQTPPVAHRDLKAENVLVNKDLSFIKIADFGLSNVMEAKARLETSCGTPDYVAPEVLLCEGYDVGVDVWSTGVLTYIMLCGYPPFYDKSQNALFKRILVGEFKFPAREWAHTSKQARRFIRSVLIVDPKERPSAAECLLLPWIADAALVEQLPRQVMRGNSVANLRVYQASRQRPQRAAAPSTVTSSGSSCSSTGPVLYPESEKLEDAYTLDREIGQGGTAVVYQATRVGTEEQYAVKRIDRQLVEVRVMQRELAIMADCQHENILALRAVYQSPHFIDLVMEYAPYGELFDLIVERQCFTESDARNVMRQVLSAVAYLHSRGIAHRDLKAENVLVSELPTPDNHGSITVKIADFGLSNVLGSMAEQLNTSCGTPDYVAPEVLRGEGYELGVDVWSCGVLTYIILCGYPPFYDDRGEMYLFQKIMAVEFVYEPNDWKLVSDDARAFINLLLVGDPVLRYTASQALQHQWLTTPDVPETSFTDGAAVLANDEGDAKKRRRKSSASSATTTDESLPSAARLDSYRHRRHREREKKREVTEQAVVSDKKSRSERRRRRKDQRQARRRQSESSSGTPPSLQLPGTPPSDRKVRSQRKRATSDEQPPSDGKRAAGGKTKKVTRRRKDTNKESGVVKDSK